MAAPRNQKQIASKYLGNLRYRTKGHYFRLLKFLANVAVLAAVAAGIFLFYHRGSDHFYSPGGISRNHAYLRDDCKACHGDVASKVDKTIDAVQGKFAVLARDTGVPTKQKGAYLLAAASSSANRLFHGVDYGKLDHSCIQCHQGFQFHAPGAGTVALQDFRSRLTMVHAGSCSTCHREHVGSGPMKLPTNADCLSCHASEERMAASTVDLPWKGKSVAESGTIQMLADGANHFIAPQDPAGTVTLVTGFATDHPRFNYERSGLHLPNTLRYSHKHHENVVFPDGRNKKLDCATCHKPEADGVFYKRVTYQEGCAACHSLQFDSRNPDLLLPHGDANAVRGFLRSLPFQYSRVAIARNIQDPAAISKFATEQYLQLTKALATESRDPNHAGEEFEKAVFFTANPYKPGLKQGLGVPGIAPAHSTSEATFPGCAYCHEVKATPPTGAPVIAPVVTADRWLTNGRFNHARHTQISCVDCHRSGESQNTGDAQTLLPPQSSCIACHRTRDSRVSEGPDGPIAPITGIAASNSAVGDATKATSSTPNPHRALSEMEQERIRGGATTDCISCHTFHSPAAMPDHSAPGSEKKSSRLKELLLSQQ